MLWATPEEYALRAGIGLTEGNVDQIRALLEDAQAVIKPKLPKGCEPDPDAARAILIKVARRASTNPGGLTRKRVGNVEEGYDDRGGLFVTDDEVAALTADCPGPSTAYTVDLVDPGIRRVGGR